MSNDSPELRSLPPRKQRTFFRFRKLQVEKQAVSLVREQHADGVGTEPIPPAWRDQVHPDVHHERPSSQPDLARRTRAAFHTSSHRQVSRPSGAVRGGFPVGRGMHRLRHQEPSSACVPVVWHTHRTPRRQLALPLRMGRGAATGAGRTITRGSEWDGGCHVPACQGMQKSKIVSGLSRLRTTALCEL